MLRRRKGKGDDRRWRGMRRNAGGGDGEGRGQETPSKGRAEYTEREMD